MLRWILQECGDFTWKVSDCEELVGSYSQGNDGVGFRGRFYLEGSEYEFIIEERTNKPSTLTDCFTSP